MSLSQLEQDTIQFGQAKSQVPGSFRRSQVDGQVRVSVREEQQDQPSEVHHRCGETVGPGSSPKPNAEIGQEEDGQASEFRSLMEPSEGGPHRQRGQCPRDEQTGRILDETLHHGRPGDSSLRGEQDDSPAHGEHRGGSGRIDRSCQGSENGAIDDVYLGVHDSMHDLNMDFQFNPPPEGQSQTFKNIVRKLVKQFSAELQAVKPSWFHQRRLDVLEVMRHADSDLTKQAQAIGSSAQRLGLAQGDPSTTDGRIKLLHMMVNQRPKHLWYSPICKPWCTWNQSNETIAGAP